MKKGVVFILFAVLCFVFSYFLVSNNQEFSREEQVQLDYPVNLYSLLNENAIDDNYSSRYVRNDTGINFLNPSSNKNGKGLYRLSSTANQKMPIVYFRGAIDNNNVIFGGYCWKIIRTTEVGGIKILYNGTPNNGMCDGKNYSIGTSTFNSNSDSGELYLSGYMYGETYDDMEYFMKGDDLSSNDEKGVDTLNFVYGSDIVYENGVYKLQDTYVSKNGYFQDVMEISSMFNYSCFTTSDTCSSVYYIREFRTLKFSPYVVKLENGKKLNDVINDSVLEVSNEKNSNVKEYIDLWFENYLSNYSEYLDDAVWCNDRSVGDMGEYSSESDDNLEFSYRNRDDEGDVNLSCFNINDSFTVSNELGNQKLSYPIGLLTADELKLAGIVTWDHEGDKKHYLYTKNGWWTMTPKRQLYDSIRIYISNGVSNSDDTNLVRPAVVLKNDVMVLQGIGTSDNPYIITK